MVEISNRRYILVLKAKREQATQLASPISGGMSGHIMESMKSVVDLELMNAKTGSIIFEGRGFNTALEVAGDIDLLTVQKS